jgi:multidrug efflux pump
LRTLIEASLGRSRAVLLALAIILVGGWLVYRDIPKEADPDVQLPLVYVQMPHEGISPEDAERLLVRPMETELRSIEGVKQMSSYATEGMGAVTLEFEAGTNIDEALADVREKVDIAKAELPEDTEEPVVDEVNLALFPVLVVTLSGEVPERMLLGLARDLQDRIEGLPNVLEVEIAGDREELLEIIIDPLLIESYGLRHEDLLAVVQRNNRLVAAGALDTGQGRFAVKVPGVFETAGEVLDLPIKTEDDRVVRLRDIATVRRTFKDPEGFARVDGRPALALEVKKRIGANIVETIEQVRAVVERQRAAWPSTVEVGYAQDKSDTIRSMLADLENNVVSAVALVMIVTVAALGMRSSLLIGLAVPGSFLAGLLVLGMLGLTVNIVVLFALIFAVGMLVDGATVVVEYADRKMAEGMHRRDAYRRAAQRMAWPVTASIATTLAAFMPLLFWPGVVGEFMKYLPITLVATLAASLLMALVFLPAIGALIGQPEASDPETMRLLSAAERGNLDELRGPTGLYVRLVRRLLHHPGKVVLASVIVAIATVAAYGLVGPGVRFFPEVEPEQAQMQVHARGDLSAAERDRLVAEVEQRILPVDGLKTVYARSGVHFQGEGIDEDVIGIILLEFTDWRTRRPASQILAEIRERTASVAGLWVEEREAEAGPPVGKPVQVEIAAPDQQQLEAAVDEVRGLFESLPGLRDVSDSRPVPGIEWRLQVDRDQAGRFGADISSVGTQVQLVTNGVLVGEYRPDDSDDEVDIRVRYSFDERNLEQLDRLRVNTPSGAVPIANFVTLEPSPRTGDIERVDGKRVLSVSADVLPGVLPDEKVREIRAWLERRGFDPQVEFTFRGEDEEQQAAQAFLLQAFGAALCLIAVILVLQFNSFYQSLLILSAVIFSTVGVLLGLLALRQPFGIVMSGVGVISLAGIVVSNNIILIDTYNELRGRGLEPFEAILRTAAQRLRPVFLTTITTVLGLLPLVVELNIDFVHREVTHGGPSADWWVELSTAVAGGLTFATLITLVLTPALLLLGANFATWLQRTRSRAARGPSTAAAAAPRRGQVEGHAFGD